MTPAQTEGRSAATGDGATSAAQKQAEGFPALKGGGRGVSDPPTGGNDESPEYRKRRWSDLHEVTLDVILARAKEAATGAASGGEGERAAGCGAGAAPAPAALPCHTADKCIHSSSEELNGKLSEECAPTDRQNEREAKRMEEEGKELFSTQQGVTGVPSPANKSIWKRGNGYGRTAKEIRATIGSFATRWGLERLGFMTHTFAGEAPTIKEARRRWRSLRINALDGRYHSWLCVLQRARFGRLHFHLVVVCRKDVRTGFDFEAVKRRDYRSASEYLRGEWEFWREACPKYSFGRSELLPVRTDAERAARYVARYISRHLRTRFPEDKRARLVSFADNAREGLARHRLHVETGGPAERRLGGLIHDLGLSGVGELRTQLGRSWRRKLGRLLDPDEVPERDFWRIVGATLGCLDGGNGLYQALQESLAAVTADPCEWQAEY